MLTDIFCDSQVDRIHGGGKYLIRKIFCLLPTHHFLHIYKNNIDNVHKSRGKAISILCSYRFMGQTLLLEIIYNS